MKRLYTMQRQRKQGEVQSQFEALSVSRLGVENKTCSRRVSAPNLRRRNPSLRQSSGWAAGRLLSIPSQTVHAKASLANTNEHPETFFLSLDLLPRVLLQPFALLAFPTPHFLVPVQRGLSANLKVLFSVSTEPRSRSRFSPDSQPAVAWK